MLRHAQSTTPQSKYGNSHYIGSCFWERIKLVPLVVKQEEEGSHSHTYSDKEETAVMLERPQQPRPPRPGGGPQLPHLSRLGGGTTTATTKRKTCCSPYPPITNTTATLPYNRVLHAKGNLPGAVLLIVMFITTSSISNVRTKCYMQQSYNRVFCTIITAQVQWRSYTKPAISLKLFTTNVFNCF